MEETNGNKVVHIIGWNPDAASAKVVPSVFHFPTFSSHWTFISLNDSDDPKSHVQMIRRCSISVRLSDDLSDLVGQDYPYWAILANLFQPPLVRWGLASKRSLCLNVSSDYATLIGCHEALTVQKMELKS